MARGFRRRRQRSLDQEIDGVFRLTPIGITTRHGQVSYEGDLEGDTVPDADAGPSDRLPLRRAITQAAAVDADGATSIDARS